MCAAAQEHGIQAAPRHTCWSLVPHYVCMLLQVAAPRCKQHGGFYLGSIGGVAAKLALDSIKKVELLEYPELGMEAVWRIEVEDFPAFIITDDKGNDFFDLS